MSPLFATSSPAFAQRTTASRVRSLSPPPIVVCVAILSLVDWGDCMRVIAEFSCCPFTFVNRGGDPLEMNPH